MSAAEAAFSSRCCASADCRCLGLESSHPAATAAWNQNRVAVVCGDLAKSPIERGGCAIVTMFHVVEHLHDPVGYLRSARDLLLPGGRLIVQVPNASSWQFLIFRRALERR